MAIFQLESLINLYFRKQKLLSLFEDTEKGFPSPVQPSANPQCYSQAGWEGESSQMWRQ